MHEWSRLTSDEIKTLDRQLPIIIPIGLVEAHGPHLTLGLDNDTADYFSRQVAQGSGAILAPAIHYGFADAMWEYQGTIGIQPDTLSLLVRDISTAFCRQGFLKQIYFSGHGANKAPCEMGFYKVWEAFRAFQPVYWNWWTEAGITGIHHADKGETEAAMGIGSPVYMDRVQNYSCPKPWHMVYSRFSLQPDSGGINGEPSKAERAEGDRIKEQVVRVLTEKVKTAIHAS